MIKPRISELQSQRKLPIDPASHRLGSLTIGKVFHKLQQGGQCQASWGFGRLSTPRKQAGKLFIPENRAERVNDVEAKSTFWKGGAGDRKCPVSALPEAGAPPRSA